MTMFPDVPKKARRKRKTRKRLTYPLKAQHIINMMTLNAQALTDMRGVQGWGFTMSQIADMTAYERSTALMNDLYRMCDDDYLRMEPRPNPSNGISAVTHYFYTLEEHAYALKQGRLFS